MIVGASISLWITRKRLSEIAQSPQKKPKHFGYNSLAFISLIYFIVAYLVVHFFYLAALYFGYGTNKKKAL